MKTLQICDFGTVKSGERAKLYTMENEAGTKVSVTDFGAALVNLSVLDGEGNLTDVVLGYDEAAEYEAGTQSLGATVGRNANRIGGAEFTINGICYELDKNDNGKNNLHSGMNVYQHRMWNTEEQEDGRVTFLLHSPDRDQGYPGNVDVRVTYELTEENELRITYDGTPDQDTILNLTNHSYFNLNGHDSGDVLGHSVVLDADFYTRADAESIPTGELTDVTDTPMDFRTEKTIGKEIGQDYEALRLGNGYDHNWVLKNEGKFAKVAQATGEKSKIVMEVWTDLPGMQMYTANFLENEAGKNGAVYGFRSAVCFETQYFPDAIHHDNFESPICKANENYHTVTAYRFRTA